VLGWGSGKVGSTEAQEKTALVVLVLPGADEGETSGEEGGEGAFGAEGG